MSAPLPDPCAQALQSIFGDAFDRKKVFIQGDDCKQEGYLSTVYFITIRGDAGDTELVVKVMPRQLFRSLGLLFENEKLFYEQVIPELESFQQHHDKRIFECYPNYLGSYEDELSKVIVLENVKVKGYNTIGSTQCWDEQHLSYVFETYGKWHGLSFALIEKRSDDYKRLSRGFKNAWLEMAKSEKYYFVLREALDQASNFLTDVGLKNDFSKFMDNVLYEFRNVADYKGDRPVIVHADAWVNNIMFKYSESGEIDDIRIIDFQTVTTGTPIWDLSYTIYSASSPAILDKLEFYLRIYHDSLSRTLEEFGCDPVQTYSYEKLLEEWKEYHTFGFISSFIDIKSRSGDDEEIFARRSGDLIRYMFRKENV